MWRILPFILLANFSLAQDLPSAFQDYLEQNESVDEESLTSFYELLEQPIDLNSCSIDELYQLPFLDRSKAQSIIKYRKAKGKITSVYELQAIQLMDSKTIRLLLPFVTVLDFKMTSDPLVKHHLRIYLHRYLEQEYLRGDYIGNPYKSYFRYSAQSKSINWGLTTEKDAGEQWLDFNSLYLNLKGENKQLFIGDYQLSLGQGLLCYQGFSFGKSAQVLGTFKNAQVLRSYTSTRENHFLRSIAYQHRIKNWQYSFFLSSNKQDANVVDSLEMVSSVSDIGLHRTESELDNKRQHKHHLMGSRLAFEKRNFKTSVYSLFQSYDKKRLVGEDTLSMQWGLGLDYSFTLKNTHFFGEYVVQQKTIAFLSAINTQLASDLSFSALYRNYDYNYYAYESNTFAEQSNTRNESGLYTAIKLNLHSRWSLSLYSDFYHFPKESYYSSLPVRGEDYFLQLQYRVRKKWEILARFQYENKSKDKVDDYGLKAVESRQQLKYLLQWKYILSDFNFKNRIACNAIDNEKGYLMVQEVNYKPLEKRWGISLRYLLFDTPSFSSRIYAYEPDVMYSFSVPFHYGEGQRISTVFKYKLQKMTLNIKLGQTLFYDNTQVKSGSVEGHKSTEVKLVLKWIL